MSELHELMAVGPLDGRYAGRVQELGEITSEFGLMKYRVSVEAEWLRTLAGGILPDVTPFSEEADQTVRGLADGFTPEDALRIKEIEKTTKHDVKAVEMWMRERLQKAGGFDNYLELIHFGRTSEDINNLAYAMMLRDVRDGVLLPQIDAIGEDLETKAHEYASMPLLAKTHGQPAIPTTLGKEMAVFVERLSGSARSIGEVAILGKFNGAVGTYGAESVAYSDVNWQEVNQSFVEGLGFTFNPVTTQIEPHDYMARFLNEVALANNILEDLATDMWQYISDGVFLQKVVEDEVSSSTMPHKVNPIDFENAEANFGLANALAEFLARKLPKSRLQRDLSDSSAQRAFGEVFGHTLVALKSLKKGLGKVKPNEPQMAEDLANEWSVLGEAVQTVMRRYGVDDAYNIIKVATRGKTLNPDRYHDLVVGLEVPKEVKIDLLKLSPKNYTGKAKEIALSTRYRREQ